MGKELNHFSLVKVHMVSSGHLNAGKPATLFQLLNVTWVYLDWFVVISGRGEYFSMMLRVKKIMV